MEDAMSELKDPTAYQSLSDAIQSLKAELLKASDTAKGRGDSLLRVKECEIELSLEFVPSVKAGVNVGVFKIEAGAGAKGAHKVKVKFDTILPVVAEGVDQNTPGPRTLGEAESTDSLRKEA
jgi:hypothetical protein